MLYNEWEQILIDKVKVTNQMVTYAKSFFIKNFDSDTSELINSLLDDIDARKPDKVIIHQSVDTEKMISDTAKFISWRLAGCEAVWGLIASFCLIPGSSEHFEENNPVVYWTNIVPGCGGGSSSIWKLDKFSLPVPRKVVMRPSSVDSTNSPLSDPDLYLHNINIEGLGEDVEASLREAVLCFKNELFLGCLALLGRASEGAWIELGIALGDVIPDDASTDLLRFRETMADQYLGIGNRITKFIEIYKHKEMFGNFYKSSGCRPTNLNSVAVWADVVRDSRNSIHYGVHSAMPNSYEKVAALLIGTVPNLRVIYSIISACNESMA